MPKICHKRVLKINGPIVRVVRFLFNSSGDEIGYMC